MPSWTEVSGYRTIGGEEPLGVSWRFEPLHAPLALAGGLMGVLRAVIEIAVLAMFHPREDVPLRGTIALQLVRDDGPRNILAALGQLAEELLGRVLIPSTLHEAIEDVALLNHRSPEVMAFTVDGQTYFISVPFVTRFRAPPPELIGIRLAELLAPLADGLIGHDDATGE
jgi:hypothetical protein